MKSTYITKPFLQRTVKFINQSLCVGSMALADCLYLAANGELIKYDTETGLFLETGIAASKVVKYQGGVAALSGGKVICISCGKTIDIDDKISDICTDGEGTLYALGDKGTYKIKDGKAAYYTGFECGRPDFFTAYGCGNLIGGTEKGVMVCFGKRPRWSFSAFDGKVKSVTADRYGHIYVATEKGAYLFDGRNYVVAPGEVDFLPQAPTNEIVLAPDGAIYYATDIGVYYQKDAERSFIGYGRWLPSQKATAVCVSDDGKTVYIGTDKGIARLEYIEMTLEQKAAYYEELDRKYFHRGNFITQMVDVKDRDVTTGSVEISDNDGLWTGVSTQALCYKYAVTGDKTALETAKKNIRGMFKLETVTGIPGFTARAIRRPGEEGYGDGDHEWRKGEDEEGPVEWKGETSSDEMVGHFSTLSLYYDLVADDEEKEIIKNNLCAIVDHIIRNDFTLHDYDDVDTTWAHWGPFDLNDNDCWFNEHGTNSLEILAFLKIVWHITGDEKYDKLYREFITKHHYLLNIVNHKVKDMHECHIDDQLAFLIVQPLLRYEEDPVLRQFIFAGMRDHWLYERVEECPMWNIVFGAFTDEVCDIDTAVKALERMPLSLATCDIINTSRPELELVTLPDEYDNLVLLKKAIPFDEKPFGRYDWHQLLPDWKNNNRILDGSVFTLPYWLGRYYGIIK